MTAFDPEEMTTVLELPAAVRDAGRVCTDPVIHALDLARSFCELAGRPVHALNFDGAGSPGRPVGT